jgi:carboxypeptidase PM20D1
VSYADETIERAQSSSPSLFTKSQNVMAEFVLDEGIQIVSDHPITNLPVALIGVAEKGFGTVKVTARTTGGHTSMRPSWCSAVRPWVANYANPICSTK